MGEQWRVMGHEINGYPELGNAHKISGQPPSYYEDISKAKKANLVLNFHQSFPNGIRTVCFENFQHSMDSFTQAKKPMFFKIEKNLVRFTTNTKLLIIQLLLGVKKLIKLGVKGRIPSDPRDIVFLGDTRMHVNHPKFVLKVEADELRGSQKLGNLLRTWVDRQKGPGNELGLLEGNFINRLGQDAFDHSICHPALWLEGTFGQQMIECYRHFSRLRTEAAIEGNPHQTFFSNDMNNYYSDWDQEALNDPTLQVIYDTAVGGKKIPYKSNFPGLFRFHRNAFLHAYDLEAPKNKYERAAKTNMTIEMLEEILAETFPLFFLHIYEQARGRFKFNSRAWMVVESVA